MISLIIVANGSGQRFGQNKMLVKIENDFLINKTVKCFEDIKEINEIILVSNQEVFDILENKNLILVNGGETRFKSVKKGLELVKEEITLIHDGARPFVNKQLILDVINMLKENDCVVPSLKVTNCLKKISNEKIETVNREEYIQTQTPQGFKTNIIKEAYDKNENNYFDDCQLLENQNYKIKFIIGDEKNKKITFITDI